MEILTNLFYQLIFTAGLVALFGILISVFRKIFLGLSGNVGRYILLIFGIVGTPIHELSHALMCVIFGHRVTKIKLFDPLSKDGTLGYVNHTYNKKNIYHQIGNFFIGTAPVVLGSGAIIGLMYFLVPEIFGGVVAELSAIGALSKGESYTEYFALFGRVLGLIFSPENFSDGMWWIFIVLAVMISSHTELSTLDIKGGAVGFVFIALLLLAVDAVVYFVSPEALTALTAAMTSFAVSMAGFLAISLVFLGFMIAIAFVLKIIF